LVAKNALLFNLSSNDFIEFILFFLMISIHSIVSQFVSNWYQYAFIPLWFFFLTALCTTCIPTIMYTLMSDKAILFLSFSLMGVIIDFLIVAILTFLNIAVLPIELNEETGFNNYTISWFIVLIPIYILNAILLYRLAQLRLYYRHRKNAPKKSFYCK
jgi:hypothetical protein